MSSTDPPIDPPILEFFLEHLRPLAEHVRKDNIPVLDGPPESSLVTYYHRPVGPRPGPFQQRETDPNQPESFVAELEARWSAAGEPHLLVLAPPLLALLVALDTAGEPDAVPSLSAHRYPLY